MSRFRPPLTALATTLATALALAAACAPLPDFGTPSAGKAASPPALLPLDDILAQAAQPSEAARRADALSARAARLQARAALMRGPVHDPATRARLAAAIARGRA